MRTGASTPEELESLLEDAFVTRDADALSEMFEEGAVLVGGANPREVRGVEAIGQLAHALLEDRWSYVAEPYRVVQARDIALLLGDGALNVVRRGPDGGWRYAIALLSPAECPITEETR